MGYQYDWYQQKWFNLKIPGLESKYPFEQGFPLLPRTLPHLSLLPKAGRRPPAQSRSTTQVSSEQSHLFGSAGEYQHYLYQNSKKQEINK